MHINNAKAQDSNIDNATAEQLISLCDVARDKSQHEKLGKLSDSLLKKSNGDRRYTAYAYFYKGLSLLFTGNGHASIPLFTKADSLARIIENDSIVALALNAKGIYHAMYENNPFVAQRYFLRSLETTNKLNYEELRARIYGNLIILSHSKNDSTGLQNAKRMYDYGKKHKKYELQYLGTYYIAMYNHLQGNDKEAEHYLTTALDIYKKYTYEDIASVYTLYSDVMTQQGNIKKAEELAVTAIQYAKQYNQKTLLSDAQLQYGKVLSLMKRYQESNSVLKDALKLAEAQNRTKVVDCYRQMAENYRALGKKDDAIEQLTRATAIMDNISTVNMDRLMHERKIMHDIEEKEQETVLLNQQIKARRTLNVVFIVAFALSLILTWYIFRLYRKRNALYKSIVIQNTLATKWNDELRRRLIHNNERLLQTEQKLERIEQSRKPHVEEDKAQELYDKLCLLMERDRIYTDTQLNREKVAEALGTNRTYLSQIIKEKVGMSYLQFINSYRINDAIRILSDKTQIHYPLKQICSDLGFNSTATFYKLFQQTVGITPAVYRKKFLDIANNNL